MVDVSRYFSGLCSVYAPTHVARVLGLIETQFDCGALDCGTLGGIARFYSDWPATGKGEIWV